MKRILLITGYWIWAAGSIGQTVSQKLQKAYQQFISDPQLKYAICSFLVMDAGTGKVIFSKNAQIGLAPASTQKIVTAAAAFDLLGKDYRYSTAFFRDKKNAGRMYIVPGGDPTFGSWRWGMTGGDSILNNLVLAMRNKNITGIRDIYIDNSGWDSESIPDGWIWQDIGNYYGAGAYKLNYRENQYDIILRSGKSVGDSVAIVGWMPAGADKLQQKPKSKLKSAGRGSGDNAYIYFPDRITEGYKIRGTIPVNENNFSISGSITDPFQFFSVPALKRLQEEKLLDNNPVHYRVFNDKLCDTLNAELIYEYFSPALDSIIYFFLQKSINLYGEALVKTIAFNKNGMASADEGLDIIKSFWEQKGMNKNELNIIDGSGLSPQNRITAHAQAEVLFYARKQPWFPLFYNAMPEHNDMKMKSGTIRGAKGFAGYHTSRSGQEYIFSFLVNNFSGSPSSLVNNMYKVLNQLK